MGRWQRASSSSSSFLLLFHFSTRKASTFTSLSTSITCSTVKPGPLKIPSFLRLLGPFFNAQGGRFPSYRTYSAAPSLVQGYGNDIESGSNGNPLGFAANSKDREDEEEAGKIPVKAYFLCTRLVL